MYILTWYATKSGKLKTLPGTWSQLQLKMWLIRTVNPNQKFWINGVQY